MKQFKMLLCIVLCITVLCGCEKMIIKEQVVMPPETKETSPVPETVAIKETEAAEFYAYDITVRSAKLAVYSAPGYHYEQMGYITDRGTYTIIAEELENLGGGKATVWGKLSTSGWINLEDAMVEEETEVLTEETEKATEGTKAPFKSYIIKLVNPLVEIYAGPGYQNQIRGEIKDKGSYTIVEESVQTFTGGRSVTWGKLKSGAGWICLDDAKLKPDGGPPYRCTKCGRADIYISRTGLCDACYGEKEPPYGYCNVCGTGIFDWNMMVEGDGKCSDCFYETLDPKYICQNCGANCFFQGIRDGLCEACYEVLTGDFRDLLEDMKG